MKKLLSAVMLVALVAVSTFSAVTTACAEEIKMVGVISKIEIAADQKSASVVLKDEKAGKDVTVLIADDLTLDKIKDKRIVEGDEIRLKYDNEGGKNLSKSFKKTAGC